MPDSIRTFIAIKIPRLEPLRRVLKELAGMGRALKAVDPDNLHVTLKFLGQTEMDLIPEVRALMERAARSRESCELSVARLGAFPHVDRPSVVWAGLEGAETLAALAAELEADLDPHGFPRENRPFVPHLTLARVKARPPESLHELLTHHAKTQFGRTKIDQLEFIRSELGPEGSRYTVLAAAPLGTSSTAD
jgi:2'-5' RNA ligase